MSLEETKRLLRSLQNNPEQADWDKTLWLSLPSTLILCHHAGLEVSDVVLDAGAGFGFLKPFPGR